MKRFTRITLIVASVCIVLGISLIIGAWAFGGLQDYKADIHIGPDGVRMSGMNQNAERLVVAEGDVQNLEITVNAADLEIVESKEGDTIALEDVSEYLEFSTQIHTSDAGKTLRLEVQRKNKYKTIHKMGEASAVLVIPEDVYLRELSIDANASDLDVQSVEAEKLEVEINASSVNIADMAVGTLDVNNNAGVVTIDGSVQRELDVEVNAGDVEVQLIGGYQDFNYSLQTNAGSIQIGEQEFSGMKNEKKIKNAEAKKMAELECNMGSITVDYFDEL